MNSDFKVIGAVGGQTVDEGLAGVVAPGGVFADFVVLHIFHLPKSDGLSNWFEDVFYGWDQLTDPPSAGQGCFLAENGFDFFFGLEFQGDSFLVVLNS